MHLGIDLGTSALKVILIDEDQNQFGEISIPFEVSLPHPLWSEQDPDLWWKALIEAI